MQPLVTTAELLELAAAARSARQRLRALRATPSPGPIRIKVRSPIRTHDRMGSGAWSPGDPLRLLILRDFANRNQLHVKTYHAFSEVHGLVLLDKTPGLLGNPQTGPFALKLGFCLAAAMVWERQSVAVASLGLPPYPPVKRLAHLPRLADEISHIHPEPSVAAALLERLQLGIGKRQANLNAFWITHAGHALPNFASALRLLSSYCAMATVFVVVSVAEFAEIAEAADPNSGEVVELPPNSEAALRSHLHDLEELGRQAGIAVIPLVVREQDSDIRSLLPHLAQLT